MRIDSKPYLCQSYGNCVALDPAHFDLDDEGVVVVIRSTVDDGELETAQAAIRSCPVHAIFFVGDDGEPL